MYGSKDTVQVTNEDTVRHMGLEHRLGAYGLETCLTKKVFNQNIVATRIKPEMRTCSK